MSTSHNQSQTVIIITIQLREIIIRYNVLKPFSSSIYQSQPVITKLNQFLASHDQPQPVIVNAYNARTHNVSVRNVRVGNNMTANAMIKTPTMHIMYTLTNWYYEHINNSLI